MSDIPALPTAQLSPNLAAARNLLATVMQWGDNLPDRLQLAVVEAYTETEYREPLPFPPSQPSDFDPQLTVDMAIELCRKAHSLLVQELADSGAARAIGLRLAAQQLSTVIDGDWAQP